MIFKVLIVVIICTELYERSVAPHPYQLLEWSIVFFFIKRILSKILIWSLHTPAEIFYCLSLKILKEALNILYFCCRIFLLRSGLFSDQTLLPHLPFTPYIRLLLLLLSCFSHVRLCATPQTAAYQAPPSMGFSRQEYWSGVPLPSPIYQTRSLYVIMFASQL